MNELKSALASRTGFYKSYIKDIKRVAVRSVNHAEGWLEVDYSFTYKNKKYVCEEHLVGDVKYSAKYEYITKEV